MVFWWYLLVVGLGYVVGSVVVVNMVGVDVEGFVGGDERSVGLV